MTTVVILDTNVLLADPTALLSFPRSDVVIPETVLAELDKLKTARVDPDLRFRGREVSRILFDLSEEGSLVDGVALPDGGMLRVAPFETDTELPSSLQTRNADDRILGAVFQMRETYGPDAEVTLVTNDLNMLLKAQTLGIPVKRHGDGVEGSWGRRYLVRPFQRYRTPITILAVALAVFLAVIVLVYSQPRGTSSSGSSVSVTNLPPEFKNVLTTSQQAAFDALTALSNLQSHPQDPESMRRMAAFYYDQYTALARVDPTTALSAAYQSIRYTDRYLLVAPNDNDAKVDEAALLFYTGQADKAIQLVSNVLKTDKNHVKGNYNLGIFLWQSSRHDYVGAAAQFEKVISLTANDSRATEVLQRAQAALIQLKSDAAAAGHPLPSTTTTQGVTIQ
ncbi:MAG TPA: PIN domain-containing protein [Coriobacteriia bacterium]